MASPAPSAILQYPGKIQPLGPGINGRVNEFIALKKLVKHLTSNGLRKAQKMHGDEASQSV